MKWILASIALMLGAPVAAASDCAPASPEANVVLVGKFYDAFNMHDGSLLEQVVARDWVDAPPPPGQDPNLTHLEGMQAAFANLDQVFSDFYTKTEEFIVSGNKVVVRSTATGRHTGTFLGVGPTGKAFSMTVIDIHTVCNGRIVRTEHVEDWLGTLVQLGALPLQAN